VRWYRVTLTVLAPYIDQLSQDHDRVRKIGNPDKIILGTMETAVTEPVQIDETTRVPEQFSILQLKVQDWVHHIMPRVLGRLAEMNADESEYEADSSQSDGEVKWDEETPKEVVEDAVSLAENIQEGHIAIIDDNVAEVPTFIVSSDDRNIWRNCILPMPSYPF
jgi:hypothetical protein